jgi:RND family efflux transporter MFP subunit
VGDATLERSEEAVLRRHLIVVVLVLAVAGGWAWMSLAHRSPGARIQVAEVERGEFVVSLLIEGTLQSDDSMTVSTGRAPGELTMIVPDGTVVRAGDVFCRIEARELRREQADAELAYKQAVEEIESARESAQERLANDQRSLEQAERDLEVWEESVALSMRQAEEQLEFDRAEAERLRLEYERAERMAAKGYQAAAEAEIAKAAYEAQRFKVEQSNRDLDLNRREIESERSQRESRVAAVRQRTEISGGRIGRRVAHAQRHAEVAARELEQIVAALADTTITAPISGTVSLFSTFRGGERRPWREGDQVSKGTPLGSISGSGNMSVRGRVRESDIGLLRSGQDAEIEFDALVGRTFPGVVSSVGGVAREVWVWEDPTAEANERVFDVLVKVKQSSVPGLKPGLNARARIVLGRLPSEVFVPLEAVFDREGKRYAYVAQGDQFYRREVETGERNETSVVVRKGLSPGEVVALSDPTRAPEASVGGAQ